MSYEGITVQDLYTMVRLFCTFTHPFFLRGQAGQELLDEHSRLVVAGSYFIIIEGSCDVVTEPILVNTPPFQGGIPSLRFRESVRGRDGDCIISGIRSRGLAGNWGGFEVAHIFPLAYAGHWNAGNFGWGIEINHPQNGMLMDSSIHRLFDNYEFSILTSDHNKIICFTPGALDRGLAGRSLPLHLAYDPTGPTTEHLNWHFRQAVLLNVRND
ncbi:hypothetical protein B9Z19DRAFT_1136564 [Tuber borchii]|uniref:Uncharacterized protein n=1 Tax=Tuber borchii TaxID=42251 RepID=A0A2T6ZBM5_TUBBO|nr:hypothetical protein B9Z19DRAFT_1136564 [Tuber borchii]